MTYPTPQFREEAYTQAGTLKDVRVGFIQISGFTSLEGLADIFRDLVVLERLGPLAERSQARSVDLFQTGNAVGPERTDPFFRAEGLVYMVSEYRSRAEENDVGAKTFAVTLTHYQVLQARLMGMEQYGLDLLTGARGEVPAPESRE